MSAPDITRLRCRQHIHRGEDGFWSNTQLTGKLEAFTKDLFEVVQDQKHAPTAQHDAQPIYAIPRSTALRAAME
jgi:hypothetical protein